jgi:hypothetical protein
VVNSGGITSDATTYLYPSYRLSLYCHAQSQVADIDKRVYLVSQEISPGDLYLALEHAAVFY